MSLICKIDPTRLDAYLSTRWASSGVALFCRKSCTSAAKWGRLNVLLMAPPAAAAAVPVPDNIVVTPKLRFMHYK